MRVMENRMSEIEIDDVEGWMARSDRSQKIGFIGGANHNVVGYSKLGCNPIRHNMLRAACLKRKQHRRGKAESIARWLHRCVGVKCEARLLFYDLGPWVTLSSP